MYRMTARSIALVSPMRQRFAALTKASKFAAEIIEKYSGTEPFPFSGETLIYFNALRERLDQEQKLRSDTTYILKLVIVRKLMLEGKLGDPTVTKLFPDTVKGSIERSLHYLRISDNNAYIRTTDAITYINNTEDLSENILLSEVQEGTQIYRYSAVQEGTQIYRYSAVDIKALTNRFFGGNSESYAYSGAYSYIEPPVFVYRKETVEAEDAQLPVQGPRSQLLTDNAVNEIISGTTGYPDDSRYSYNSENLTYRTENTADDKASQKAAADKRSDSTPTLAETIAGIGNEDLRRAGELPEISLLVMNSFLSGGTEYLSSIKNRYIHKRISLAPAAVPAVGSAAAGLLNSPASSFGAVSYAVSLLASEKVSDPYERRIYDTAVTKVYAERHSYAGLDTKQMLAGMSPQERTKVLSLIVRELGSGASVPVNVQLPAGKAAEADIPAVHTAAPSETERRTIRTVVKKFVDSIIKPSGMDKTASVKSAESDERVRVLTAPAAEKFTVTETEMTLLKLLSEDKSGNIAKAVKASGNGGDTVSARLNVLYHGIAGGSTEKIVAENVENALYMPTVLNFYDTARLIPAEPAENTPAAQIIAADSGDVRITNNRAADNRELPVYRTDIRNINNIQTHAGLTQNTQDTVIQQDIYAPSEMRGIQGTNMAGVRTVADAAGSYGSLRVHNASRGVPANAYPSAAILRSGIYSGGIVRKALEKIAGYERVHNAPGTPTGKRGTASEIADGRGYADTARNFVFSTAVNEYSLPVILLPENKVSESVRLLPVYTLDRVILPEKLPEIKTNGKKALNRLSAPKERSFAVLKHRMAIINDRKMSAKKSADSAQESTGFPVSAETYTVPMDRMMPDETVLSYREPIPASAPAPATPAVSQPSTSDLVKQFGNLIEGGDAGLVPSFDVGTRGIGEAMAAIEETAEKVAVNSKLIEEIREKQRTIETVTLKSSDMDAISEEMIRRLRSRMRLDRSRFAGQ